MIRGLFLILSLLAVSVSYAEYDDYCYGLADKLAYAPSTMKVGELDGLKSCIQEIQRAVVVMHEDLPPRTETSTYREEVVCAVAEANCPAVAEICPAYLAQQNSSNAQKEKEAAKKRKLQLQKFKPVLQAY